VPDDDGPVRVTATTLDVLQALLDAGGDELHGWAITRATRLSSPTVYKILERLTSVGWVLRRWEELPPDTSRPRRRFYRLTADGAVKARALIRERRQPNFAQKPRLAFGGADAR